MKLFLFTTAVLLSAAAYSQSNLVAASDSMENEKMASYTLKEIVVPNASSEVLLGELNVKSKKGETITATSKLAYYFGNDSGEENIYLKSVLFKVQKVKYTTKAYVRLYKKHDYVQDSYHPKTGAKISYDSFIPGEQIATQEIVVYLQPGQKDVVEIDLSAHNIVMPADGLFLSVEGGGYFDAAGEVLEGLKAKDMTWIDFHPTAADNYCDWINPFGTQSWFWVNTNKLLKSDYETVLNAVPPVKSIKAPNFGLKVQKR